MEINDLISMLTDGLPADQAAIVRAAVERDAVKAKAAGLKQQSEFDALQARITAFQQELEDQGTPGQQGYKAGAKTYQKWYTDNYPAIQKLDADLKAYKDKYGTLENPKGTPTTTTTTTEGAKVYTQAEIDAMVDARIQQQYAPRWSDLLVNTGTLLQKHLKAGRSNSLDFKVIGDLAQSKYAGNLELAYDEWDKPEREKAAKEAEDKRIEARVQEELQKRGATMNFPSGGDMGPSSLSAHTKADIDKYDPVAAKNELAATWMKAGQAA